MKNFLGTTKTPIGFDRVADTFKGLIFIEDRKIFRYDIEKKTTEQISDSLFNFISGDVLKLDMSNLPKNWR